MSKEKTFRVYAKVVSYCYYDIKAKSASEAEELIENQLGEDIDGGDFIDCDKGGSFTVAPEEVKTHELK